MLTRELIIKIQSQLDSLKQQTAAIDEHNRKIRSSRFVYRDIFNRQLFRCDSTQLFDYVLEAEKNFQNLLHSPGYTMHLAALGEKLNDQLAAIAQAVRANEVVVKEHSYQTKSNQKRFQNRNKAKTVAKHFMANSHELHQELAQNHEYERRLNEMIYERQAQIPNADEATTSQLQREILALHQRLGKCRRAITAVEERIQLADSKNRA